MKLSDILVGAAVGAGLMYLFDPHAGNYRRGLVRDQIGEVKTGAADKLDKAHEDTRHLFNEVTAEITAHGDGEADHRLRDHVRATLERRVSYANAIHVEVAGGRVTLRGPILAHDLLAVLTAARAVHGITSVDSQLDIHPTSANTPEFGSATPPVQPSS